MSTLNNDQEYEKKLKLMKIMILRAEKNNLSTREKTAEGMANDILKIIKNVHNQNTKEV